MLSFESFNNDPRIRQIVHRRQLIEQNAEQRRHDMQSNVGLDYQKVEKELEYLIQDKYLIDKRNAKLNEMYHGIKQRTLRNIAQVRTSADQLTACKQGIYEHLFTHKPRDAERFLQYTNTKPKDHRLIIEENQIQGAQVLDKEREMRQLKLQNENLAEQLKLMQNQEQFMKDYANNPYLATSLLNKIMTKPQERNRVDSKMSESAKEILLDYLNKNNESKEKVVDDSNNSHDQLNFGQH